jgi:hypothetical protein
MPSQGVSVKDGNPQTINALIDAYVASSDYTKRSKSTRDAYRRHLQTVRNAWGELHPDAVEPRHVKKLMETLASTPSTANMVLVVIRIVSGFGRSNGYLASSWVEGLKPN